MGVPGFFASLIKKYDIVISYILDNYIYCNELYFDTNCLIHPVCMDVYKNNLNLNNNDLEDKMIKSVIEYIEKIILFFLDKYNNDVLLVAKKLYIGKSTIYRLLQKKKTSRLIN